MVTLTVTFVPSEVVSATTLTTGSLCSLTRRSRVLRGWPGVGAGRGVSCAEVFSIELSGLRWGVEKDTFREDPETRFLGDGFSPR